MAPLPIIVWSPTMIKDKLRELNATLPSIQKRVLLEDAIDSHWPLNLPLGPDNLMVTFGTPEQISTIRSILKLIPMFYASAAKYYLTGHAKHALETIVSWGHTQNRETYILVDHKSCIYGNVSREATVLALMMCGLTYKFEAKLPSFFIFKARPLHHFGKARWVEYQKVHGIYKDCFWSVATHFALPKNGCERMWTIMLAAQRRRGRLPSELWQFIFSHMLFGEFKGRYDF